MNISLKLLETTKQIQKNINSALAIQLNDTLSKNMPKLQKDLINIKIPEWLNLQPEIQALRNGELTGLFGFTLPESFVADTIIDSIAKSTIVSITKYDQNLKGGLEISIQPTSFANVLSLSQGRTVYSGGDLHWLAWLLLRGDETIVIGYQYNPQTGLGRTRLGNMVPGNSFRVPPQYSGTKDNNFITRALTGSQQVDYITKLIQQAIGG